MAVIDNGSSTTSARYDANNLNTGEWAHVALTWSSGNGVTIYINGVNELTGAPLSGTINVVGDQMQIGTSALSSEREFEGQIDEIRIWDAALSETTIRDWLAVKYESGAGHPNDANLIAYYRCDDLAGTVLGDLAGSLDGSLNGGATFTTSGAYIGDESAFTTTTSVALGGAASGNNLTVNNIQGSPDITYLYRVNEAPNDVLLVAGLDVLNTTDYYGVFQSGGSNPTFNAQWFYSGNLTVNGQNAENGVRFMKRENNADGNFYEFSSSILDVDSSLNIVIDRNVRSGEFGQGQVDPYPTPVPPGNALTFDGVDDYIDLGTDLESVFAGSDKAFTIEAWINPETFTGDNRKIILAKNGNSNCGADERQFSFVASSDEGLRFTYYGANDVSQFRSFEGGSISTNTWQHVAVTYDGSVDTGDGIDRVNFYINGILQTTVADGAAGVFPFNISSGPSHVGIGATLNSLGALCDNPDHVFDGPIDEVRIWDTTLDNATILAHVSAVVDNTHPNYENLVSYHRFDDSDGSASIAEVRDLAGTNDGVLNGFPGDNSGSWSVSGALDATVLPNNAIDFDGTNDHIDIGDPVELMIAGDLTLEAWVNWDGITPSHDQTIVGRTFQHETAADNILYQLGIDSEGKLFFHFEHDAGINSPDLSSIDVMPNGEWIHVAAVRDATAMTVTLYLNGVPLSMVTGTYPNNANGGESSSQRVMIGRRNPNNFDYFDGRIDEVRIWNSPRTLGEIQTNLYAALDGSETGLVAYYNFDQGVPEGSNGSETTLFDITANGNDGLLTGMALTGANSNWVSSQFETPFASSDLFTTEVSSSQIDLSWTDNALNETGYTIERSDGNNFSYSFLATAASDATSFSDNTVSLASGYFYRVVANGMYDSNPSNEKFGSTIAPPGVALEFDGVDDFVDLSSSVDNLTFSAPATIEFWAKINYDHTVASNFKTILSLGEFANDEFVIGIGDVTVAETNELLAIQVTTAGGANRTVVNYLDGTDITGQWHHYAVTADGTNYQLYFDGHPVAATTVVGGGFTSSFVGDFGENITSPSAAYIGQREGQGQFFDGEIDELRVWNDVRTPVEILSNLTVPLVGNEANLVSYYKFDQDEPTDLLLPDRSTNNFDGSWTDAGGGTTVPQWVASEIGFFTVVNTNDSGSGSLRWCIDNANANPGKDMINFAIPPTDPGYVDNSGYETWTISPTTNLPSLTEEVIIDGSTQTGSGQFNVILDGLSGATRAFGLASSNNEIYGLYITDFDVGIHVNATNGSTIGAPTKGNTIVNCSIYGVQTLFADNMIYYANYIGTDEFGNTGLGNDCGICSQTGSSAHTIGGFGADEFNVISGNNTGIGTNGAGNSFIQANLIGTDPTGMNAVPNGIGINLFSSGGTQIIGNTISGNTGNGILLVSSGGVIIRANIIGLTIDEMNPLGNGGAGIITSGGSPNGVFGGFNEGDGNIIANNGAEGIELVGAGDINIRLLRNEIYCNGEGIALNGGNNGIGAPTISRITVDAVSGTGIVGETIDLYRDNSGCLPYQGQEYLGSDVVDGSGDWEVSGLTLDLSNDYFTATASNGTDGTSAFSASYTVAPINALDFDGVNDRVIVTDDPNLDFGTGGFTIEFWLNASSNTPINQSIGLISKTATFENTPGWSIDINTFADPGVQIDITNGPRDGTGGTAWRGLQYGRWYHVAMVRGSADLKLYIDGIHVNTEFNPVVLGDVSNAENLVIGDSWGIEYEGMLDEIRLWNVERTEAEIQSTILQTLVGDEPNLVAYYNFDHGLPGADNTTPPANVLSDKTANGLDGSLSNFALNGATSNWVNSGSLDPTPNEPVDLTTTEIGSTTIELNWTDQSFNESDFLIYRSDGDNTNFAQIDMVEADAATYPDNSVTPGNGYFYRVVATDGTLNSDPSNEKFGSTITPPGNALDFDGVDDFVDLGDVHDEVFAGADKSFTIESWIYLTAIGSNGEIILSKQGNTNCGVDERQVTFGVREDGILRLGYYGDLVLTQLRTIGGTTVLNLNEWYHVAATYDGAIDANDGLDRVKIYVNGVEETTSILTSTGVLPTEIPSGPAHLAIGSNVSSTGAACSGADQIFSGSIDELRLWNGIRSETEIQNNLSTVLVGNESGLAAYYRFDQDEPTDLILPDRSLNQNDGAWNGNGGGVTTPQWIPSGAFNVDIVPPTVLTQDIVVSLDATGNVSITASQVNNGSSDNIVGPGDLILTLDKSDFDCTELGDNTVTLSVNDGANISSETATVTVIDDMDPVVIVQNISVTLDAEDLATITTISVDNGSSDNCSIALSLDIDSFGKTEVGDNTVTLTATDGSGNSATATATVTVLDNNGPPDFSFIFYLDENSEEGTLIGTVVATDLEDDPLTYSILSGNTNSAFAIGGSSGDITVASQTELDFETTPVFNLMVQASDGNGGESMVSITVNLNDIVDENPLGLEDQLDQINVYPNPAHGSLFLELGVLSLNDLKVHLFTVSGSEVELATRIRSKSVDVLEIGLENLDAGIYLLKIESNKGVVTKNILVR
ncbi:MAG: LamG-like jellyroll fold domain-containing protein [Cyclobacteriaceae bacterium]